MCAAAPSARAPASRPPGGCRLPRVSVCTHAHTGVHAPPPDTCSSRTCGRTPLSASSYSRSPSPAGGLPLPRLVDPAQLPQVPLPPVSGPLQGLSHSWRRCPTDMCPSAGTPAAATAAPPRSADPCPFTFRLCPFTWSILSWRCAHFFSHPSLGPPLLRRSVTFETWNSRGNLKRASCP